MTSQTRPPEQPWPEAMATVTSCKYEFGAGQALAFGVPLDKHFAITFNYWANGELHNASFQSATAVPQGTLFPVTYNPAAPHEHTHRHSTAPGRSPRLAIGVAGSVLLLLLWLAIMHGCRR